MKCRKQVCLTVAALAILLCLSDPVTAQCAMCRWALVGSPEGQQMAGAFNRGILLLLGAPFSVVAVIVFLIFRAQRSGKAKGWDTKQRNVRSE